MSNKYLHGGITLSYAIILLIEAAIFLIPGEVLLIYSLKSSRVLENNNEPLFSPGAIKWMFGVGMAQAIVGGIFSILFFITGITNGFRVMHYALGLALMLFVPGLSMVIKSSREKKKWVSS